jgi:hypothetical protein
VKLCPVAKRLGRVAKSDDVSDRIEVPKMRFVAFRVAPGACLDRRIKFYRGATIEFAL